MWRLNHRFAVAGALAGAFALSCALQVLAYEPPAGTVEFGIEHSKYGEIGTHRLAFSYSGGDLIVDIRVRIKVKILFITAHSLVANRRETWRDGRLVAYDSNTDENGTLFAVSAREEGDRLIVEGPQGRAEADGPVFPTNPWHPDIVRATVLMDTKTGELLHVSVAPAGEEDVKLAGRTLLARKYVISGDMERELWFDPSGNLLRFRFKRDGATLTFTRTTPLP